MFTPPTTLLIREFARHPARPPRADPLVPGPRSLETDRLIEHIIRRYHETHRREFPEAIRLARRVEAAHADHPRAPRGLPEHLALMSADLEEHQQKEEQVLFPLMLGGGSPMIRFPIGRMMADHDELEEQLARLRALTDEFSPPEDACATWRDLCRACSKLHDDLVEHMRIENNILFKRFLD